MKMLEAYHQKILGGIHRSMLADLLPMEITPAAAWFLGASKVEAWSLEEDFPRVVPPSPLTWLEFVAPQHYMADGQRVANTTTRRAGALCVTLELEPTLRARALEDDLLRNYLQALSAESRGQPPNWRTDPDERAGYARAARAAGHNPRWLIVLNLVSESRTRQVQGLGLYGLYLNEQGQVVPDMHAAITPFDPSTVAGLRAPDEIYGATLTYLFALSLAHSKEVSLREMPLPPKLARRRQREGIPTYPFRALDIKAIQQASGSSDHAGGADACRAMHLVRADMEVLDADTPLFGERTETRWWHLLAGGEQVGVTP